MCCRYTIISGDKRGDFSIDENTGVIRVNKQLDYERKNTYELTIQAEDGAEGAGNGERRFYDTAAVTLHVLDTNDCPPAFLHSPYNLQLMENEFDPDRPVFMLEATDHDDPPYNEIEYSIRSVQSDFLGSSSSR